MSIKVIPVEKASQFTDFIRFPHKLLKSWRKWVPPVRREIREDLDTRENPYYRKAESQLFLAMVNGKVVGRIAAFVDPNYIKIRNRAIGLFGYFDVVKNKDISAALFNTASHWLRQQGMVGMAGPTNPAPNDKIGVLLEGYDKYPYVKTVWNPPYYVELYEIAGFKKNIDLHAYDLTSVSSFIDEEDTCKREIDSSAFEIRHLSKKNIRNDLNLLRKVYIDTWSTETGFIPWSKTEYEHFYKKIIRLIDPDLTLLAFYNNKPIGCTLGMPDRNFILRRFKGKIPSWAAPRVWWLKRKTDRFRIAAIHFHKDFLDSDLDKYLMFESCRLARNAKLPNIELSWVHGENARLHHSLGQLGAKQTKLYRLYERKL